MAGGISDDDIQKVREASDIVAVIGERTPVKQKGRDFWCCCPLHNEKTPSFKIDPATQLWHCFGCGEGGDVFSFIMKTEDMTFPEAVRRLAERAHIDIVDVGGRPSAPVSKKARLKAVCDATAEFYHLQLMRSKSPDAARAREYLAGRGLGGHVPKKWLLGYAPGRGALVRHLSSKKFSYEEMVEANVASRSRDGKVRDRFYDRVMFPILDAQGECIAFGGRVIGKGEPKYLNSQETPIFYKSQVLYGLNHAKATMASTGVAVVVEGYTDVIALHEGGMANAVATLGTALTMKHIRALSRHAQKKIVYLFDGDEAGQRAADRALQFIDSQMTPEAGYSRIELCAVTLPDNLDPAEFVAERGAQALQQLVDTAQPLLKYGIDRRLARYDLGTAEGRSHALSDALSVLAPIKDSLLAKDYAVQIASRCRAREDDVLQRLSQLVPPRRDYESNDSDSRGNRSDRGASRSEHGEFETTGSSARTGADGNRAGGSATSFVSNGSLPQSEVNRLRCEREFLSLLAQKPAIALLHADALASTQWHERVHALLAESILSTLAADENASAALVVSQACQAHPRAAGILTSAAPVRVDSHDLAAFLAEELAIGDAEDAIAALRAQLSDPAAFSHEDHEIMFQYVAELQKDLIRRKASHKPLAQI